MSTSSTNMENSEKKFSNSNSESKNINENENESGSENGCEVNTFNTVSSL